MAKSGKYNSVREWLESFNGPNSWAHMSKEQVEEVMNETGGLIRCCGRWYSISFRPAFRALSAFVFERSGCKKGDYKVALVNPHMVRPYREWD